MRKRDKKRKTKKRAEKVLTASVKARRINKYICQVCGGAIVTIDRDEGITPPVIACKATDGCTGAMTSNFYAVDESENPTFEFYRPQNIIGEIDDDTRRYLDGGGLVLRKISTASRKTVIFSKPAPPETIAERGNVTADDVRKIAGKYATENNRGQNE